MKLEKASMYSEQTKEHLSLLLDNMPVIVYTCEAEGDFACTYISDSITAVTGYKPDDFVSNPSFWSDHIHTIDKPRIFNNLQKLFKLGHHEHEYRWKIADGSYIWLWDALRLIKLPDGTKSHIVGAMYEITERKCVEEELQLFRELINQSNDAIFVIDPETSRFLDINQQAFTSLGYTRKELLSKKVIDIEAIIPDEFSWKKHIQELREKEKMVLEGAHKRKDGTTFPAEISVQLIPQREKVFMVAVVRNITERKRAEEDLLKQQYFLSKAQEMGKIGTWELDIEKNILVWTDELYRMFELPIGTKLTYEIFLDCVHPDDREYVDREWKAAFNKKPYDIEHRLLMNDGSIKWLREKAILEFDEQGNCLKGIGFAQDITERKRAEEEIKARQREIEEINANLENRVQEEVEKSRQKDYIMMHQARLAAMGEMIGHIAHQWKQPLNALNILMFNIKDSLDDLELNKEMLYALIPTGEKLIEKMSKTIDDFRNFFKPDKQKETFSINKSIKDTLSIVAADFKYHNISVSMNEGEEITILGFHNEYSQVILNIISNAMDAIIAKGIGGEIRIDLFSEDDSAIIGIKDNAGGIPEEIINHIFDPYFTTKEGNKGTGIGLYISKMIIEDHMGGRIDVQNIDDGAEFRIIIPMIQS
jgi:PAS domain S-box-containing protein